MRHVLALDQGTTGSTALVLDESGCVTGRGYREITQHYPRPGWVEQDPDEILARTIDAARDAIAAAGVSAVDAVGISNQRETIVLWDRESGRPAGRAIVWQDRRTAPRCAELAPRGAEITARTGLVLDPYFSATKLEWMLRDAELRRRAESGALIAGTIDSWLIARLTGGAVHATDFTNASRTMLFDLRALAWSDPLCDLFGVPRSLLPEVRRSSGDFGIALGEMLGHDAPILGVAGDQQAALFGQGCVRAGEGKNTYGTGAFLLLHTGAEAAAPGEGLLATVACDPTGGPAYALEASIFVAGAAIQWLRDGLGIIERASDTEALARSLASNDGVYFVPALVGLGAPHWSSEARGTIVGLTQGTGRAHIARAALEAMAYATREVLDVMRARAGDSASRATLRVDGGVTANDWLMQFQADVLDVAVERPDMIETTALGAAGLAGIAAGIWSSSDDFRALRRLARFEPGEGRALAREGMRGWHRAVRAALAWASDAG